MNFKTSSIQFYRYSASRPRARQNVVFECGLFVGHLKRKHACCLYTGDIDLPSYLSGRVYIKYSLSVHEKTLDKVKELRAAGYIINI